VHLLLLSFDGARSVEERACRSLATRSLALARSLQPARIGFHWGQKAVLLRA